MTTSIFTLKSEAITFMFATIIRRVLILPVQLAGKVSVGLAARPERNVAVVAEAAGDGRAASATGAVPAVPERGVTIQISRHNSIPVISNLNGRMAHFQISLIDQ